MVVDLDELNLGELFEVRHDRLCDAVECPVRLTTTREVDVCDAVSIFDPVISSETVEHERKALVALHITGTLEEFIEHSADQVP